MRCIFHIDMDAFFASVEVVANPSLKGKPVVVGGRPNSRGVVSTCSYEARAFGVRSAMSLSEAHRLCPHGIFLDGNFGLYREYSDRIMEIFHTFSPYIEAVSIDEAYLDMSAQAEEIAPTALARAIKHQVLTETKLTCSVGIATNKLVAKIASSKCKPNGLLEIIAGNEAAFLSPMSVQSIHGIGAKTQQVLNREGINTVSDLQAFSMDEMIRTFGAWGYYYYHASRGEDNRAVQWEETSPKSIGAETTFMQDQIELEVIHIELKELLSKAYSRLRSHKMRARRVSLKLRFSDFKTITRSQTLSTHLNDYAELERTTHALLSQHYDGCSPLRLIGVAFEQLTDSYWQPTFWDGVSLPVEV